MPPWNNFLPSFSGQSQDPIALQSTCSCWFQISHPWNLSKLAANNKTIPATNRVHENQLTVFPFLISSSLRVGANLKSNCPRPWLVSFQCIRTTETPQEACQEMIAQYIQFSLLPQNKWVSDLICYPTSYCLICASVTMGCTKTLLDFFSLNISSARSCTGTSASSLDSSRRSESVRLHCVSGLP